MSIELTGLALDWAVSTALGMNLVITSRSEMAKQIRERLPISANHEAVLRSVASAQPVIRSGPNGRLVHPANDPHMMVQLMVLENIMVSPPTAAVHRNPGGWQQSGIWSTCTWTKGVRGQRSFGYHETDPAIAVARCFVLHRLGEVVDVPEELR